MNSIGGAELGNESCATFESREKRNSRMSNRTSLASITSLRSNLGSPVNNKTSIKSNRTIGTFFIKLSKLALVVLCSIYIKFHI